MIINLTDENFDKLIMSSNKVALINFSAPWCNPCKAITPIISAIAEKYKGNVNVGKINIDENSELVQRFMVRSVPTIVLIKNRNIVDRHVGFIDKDGIENLIKKHL